MKTTVSNVTADSATLGAEINPNGLASSYHFEYGAEDCSDSESACTSVPVPDSPLGSGTSPVSVTFPLTGLTPGTTYHLLVVASNSDGQKEGADRIFATYALPFDGLPDGRAYEQASPVKKNGADARGMVTWAKASSDGDRVAFLSASGIPGGEGGQEVPAYLASRGSTDWSTQGLLPPASLGSQGLIRGWLPDFSTVFDFARNFSSGGGGGAFLARSSTDGTLSEILGAGEGMAGSPNYAGASSDGSKVLFETNTKLACCDAALAGKPNVYLWDSESGEIHLADVLNDKKAPKEGASAGPYDWMQAETLPLSAPQGGSASFYYTQDLKAISTGGDVVYFTAVGAGGLYARVNPTAEQSPVDLQGKCTDPALACTLLVSATRRTPPDPLGSRPAAFMGATPDGEAAFFTSPEELTDESNTGPAQLPPSIGSADVSVEPPTIEAGIPSIAAGGIARDSKYIYWVDTAKNTIGRVELNGENVKSDFIKVPELEVGPGKFTPAKPQYVAVDAEHVYWSNEGEGENKEGTVGRSDIEGTVPSIEVEWIKEASRPRGIAVDSEHVYWANAGSNEPARSVAQAEIGGGGVNQAFIKVKGNEFPEGVAVDGEHIYWTVNESNGSTSFGFLLRANLDGSSQEFKFIANGAELRGIAIDAGHVYWASRGEEAIGRANLDLEEIKNKFIELDGLPKGLASDGSHLWWSLNGEAVPNPGNDLYRYRAADESLVDLTYDPADVNGAEVKGVLGASEDGKRVYVAANGDLDGSGEAQAGDCRGSVAATILGFSGQCGLYLLEEGEAGEWSTEFIARLDASGKAATSDATNWMAKGNTGDADAPFEKSALTSADGATLLFRSQEQLTDYDNEGRPELYRFEVGEEGPSCVSCNPSGEAPVAAPRLGSIGLSATFPSAPAFVLSRNLSADGNQVFFESPDPLVIDDTNGKGGCEPEGPPQSRSLSCQDVYEWEAQGTGSCKEDVQGGDCLYLLSTGTSPNSSFFIDASLSGNDAFIATRSAGLVRQDQDKLQDIYAARVGGGLPSQDKAPPPECESLDSCHRPQGTPPGFPSPTSTNPGPANKKHVRPRAKKHHKKHHHKRKRAAHKAGGKNR